MTFSKRFDLPELLNALIPRSDSAKLIDLVKLSGVVRGSRRSVDGSGSRWSNVTRE
jgi:hypothetical protein